MFNPEMRQLQTRINEFLETDLDALQTPHSHLMDCIKYAVLNGGKRIRPLLAYASAQAIDPNIDLSKIDPAAAALEYIHCYSLVHDDLPAMDDDDLRRGQPTCHKKFDEASAILAGDALQTEAFRLLIDCPLNESIKLTLLSILHESSSISGMIGGQAIDLAFTNRSASIEQLKQMHQMKTGALIRGSVLIGAHIAQANAQQLAALDRFSQDIGLAFQVQDDILDIESTSSTLGKMVGSDISNNKSTYPSLLGIDAAKVYLDELLSDAMSAIQTLNQDAQLLIQLGELITKRKF